MLLKEIQCCDNKEAGSGKVILTLNWVAEVESLLSQLVGYYAAWVLPWFLYGEDTVLSYLRVSEECGHNCVL